MVADDINLNESTEQPEGAEREIDQPSQYPTVSMESLLGEADGNPAEPKAEKGATAAKAATPGDANPQPSKGDEPVYRTQADLDRAFGQRAAQLRRQIEREHADDLAVAKAIRSRYPGKSLAEIQDAIIQDEAKELALNAGYSEEEALQKVQARRDFERRASMPDGVDPDILQKMADQMDDFGNRFGLDLQAEIEADEGLLKLISPEGDMSAVALELLDRRSKSGAGPKNLIQQAAALRNPNSAPAQPVAPRVERRAPAASAASAGFELTDALVAKIDAELQKGHRVTLPR
jgi:hypothetical protein